MGPNMPMEKMAQCARDKLEASARGIWSSIRSLDDATSSRRGEAAESPQASENTTSTTMSLEKIENVFKVMFGSCSGASGDIPHSPTAEVVDANKPFQTKSKSTRSREFVSGEHVYAQLFVDDQTRAVRAVDGLREKAASSSSPLSKSPRRATDPFPLPAANNMSGLFSAANVPAAPPTARAVDVSGDFDFDDGISAISAHTLDEMARIHEHKITSPSNNSTRSRSNLYGNRTKHFDTISYPQNRRSRSAATLPSSPPATSTATTATTSPPVAMTAAGTTAARTTPNSAAAPLKFTRGRSSGTISMGTKSTKSSQDSEFASFWRKEERKYWDDVVEQEKKAEQETFPLKPTFTKKARRRSRSSTRSGKQTVTTVSSSSFSNFNSHFDKNHHHHPHDFIQFRTRDLVDNPDIFHRDLPNTSMDHSRIKKCLVVPYGSQMGEI